MNNYIEQGHPLDEQLAAWLDPDGERAALESAEIEQHLAECDQCGAWIEELGAVERGLQALSAALPVPPVGFQMQVMAALPSDLYSRVPVGWDGFIHGVRQQIAALAFLVTGLASLLTSGDALDVASQWWGEANTWLGNASVDNSTWLSNLPGGALESHLGLLPGAVLMGIGAFIMLVNSLRAAVTRSEWRMASAGYQVTH